MKKENRRKKIYLIGGILLSILLLVGATFAFFTLTAQGSKINAIRVGPLSLVLTEGEAIVLENTYPMTEQEGMSQTGFSFSLENKGTTTTAFTIYLDEGTYQSGETKLEDMYLKYNLETNETVGTSAQVSTLGSVPNRILATGELAEGTINHYNLKLWIDSEVNGAISGKTWRGKIRVVATQPGDGSNANPPVLASNMIPVTYNKANTRWEKADITGEWYNYDKQEWANAVTVTDASRSTYQSANTGTEVKMDDILQMFVWIPRYSYTIKSEDGTNYYGKQETGREDTPTKALPGEIDVKFISTDTKEDGSAQYTGTTEPSGWYTPPGFTFGEKELPGIWVGKFESGATNNTSPGDVTTNNLLAIKPNITSWRSIRVSTLDLVSRGVVSSGNIYGFDSTYDSHAMKNTEWALVAYLTQSKYGKYGNPMYTGANKEIYMNNYNGYRTGCSSGQPSASSSSTCEASYDVILDQGNGLGAKGAGASTTGNIYGIYDMNGGAWEYMMGSYNKYSGYSSKAYTIQEAQNELGKTITSDVGTWNSGYTGTCGFDGKEFIGREWPESKYYDLYTTSSTTTACGGSACKGRAFNEVAGWYSDYSSIVWNEGPWLIRGGYHYNSVGAGIFYFNGLNGSGNADRSFRLVLAP